MRAVTRAPAEEQARGRFVGRTRELGAVREAIEPGRIVTIVGPPGVGKTRLAREIVFGELETGVESFFCDLVEPTSREEVFAAVARALDVGIAGPIEDATSTIARALSARDGALLVLDNFEHLVDEVADAVQTWAEHARIVVTSRQRLGIERETVVMLEPLGVPEPGSDPLASESVQLFLDRFLSQNRGYLPTVEEIGLIAELCRTFDGLPLAIVLMASRARPPLTPNTVAFTTDTRSSLADAIGASWELLSGPERELVAQCSVFRGGFDERAAVAVVELPSSDLPATTSEVLARAVNKSLIAVHPTPSGVRYSMLLSIRDFAEEWLRSESGDDAYLAAVARHAQHYVSRSREAMVDAGADDAVARDALAADVDNLLIVHKRDLDHSRGEGGDATDAVEAALALAVVMAGRSPMAKTLSLVDAAVAACSEDLPPEVSVRVLLVRSRLLEQMGQVADALSTAKLGREMAAGDERLTAEAHLAAGRALLALGRWREAREALSSAIDAFRAHGMTSFIAPSLVALGDTWFYEDDLAHAEATYRRALETAEAHGGKAALGLATHRMAIVEMELGRSEAALRRYGQAIGHFRAAGDRSGEASATTYLAILEHDLGLHDVARARFETLIVTTRELGNRRLQGIALLYLGTVLVDVGDVDEAKDVLTRAERVLGEVNVPSAEAYARAWLAVVVALQDDADRATDLLERARAALRAMKEQSFYTTAVEILAGQIDLAAARRAEAEGDAIAGNAHRAAAKRRLEAAPGPEQTQSDVRIARRVLERALGVTQVAPRRVSDAPPTSTRALVVERTGAWFRPPNGEAVDIARRVPLKALLALLLHARLSHPGRVVPAGDLMKAAWNGPEDSAALQNRLRVAIATLRKLGLSTLLFTRAGGYLLDPAWTVLPAG